MIKKRLKTPSLKLHDADDRVRSALVSATATLIRAHKSPDEAFGDLFRDVQTKRIYGDGKTFADLVPKTRVREIKKEYNLAKKDPHFNLKEFVSRHFYEFVPHGHVEYFVQPGTSARQHVANLWKVLERRNRRNRGSLFALPNKYLVPGGRFQEQFYWDSYFVMLGLAADNHWVTIHGMLKNYSHMLRRFGFIPTANRTYFLSRSQPPFFSYMVALLSDHRGKARTYLEFLPALLTEYRFWMKGRRSIHTHAENQAFSRVVKMPDGSVLNRYFDNKTTPRPEMQGDDLEIAGQARTTNKDKMFLDFRAAAESGWDFSSRWFRNPKEIQSIHTTDIAPVDLNCLLYHHENILADSYKILHQPMFVKKFLRLAANRADTINKYCWDEKEKFYCDYDFRLGQSTGRITMAGVFPLYAGIAPADRARYIAERLEKDFLKEGGLVTTLDDNGQQWDSPNGWAPLQWVAILGLRRYGYGELANEIRDRWLKTNELVFARKQKMLEKYNVVEAGSDGRGGEYPVQDGFGWTNGVYAALKDEVSGGVK